jgi:hypothetical protein
MAKSHKRRRSFRKSKKNLYRSLKKTTKRAIPIVASGIKTVGKTSVKVVKKSAPIVEKGVGAVYGVLAEGFDMGVKGLKKTASVMKQSRKTRKHRRR